MREVSMSGTFAVNNAGGILRGCIDLVESPDGMAKSEKRNLNPTAPAVLAMWRWGEEYAAQRGGVMDFWDTLSESRKRLCVDAAERVAEILRPSGR